MSFELTLRTWASREGYDAWVRDHAAVLRNLCKWMDKNAPRPEARGERELIEWAADTLVELNPSNYDHDDVCRANNASVEVILALNGYLKLAAPEPRPAEEPAPAPSEEACPCGKFYKCKAAPGGCEGCQEFKEYELKPYRTEIATLRSQLARKDEGMKASEEPAFKIFRDGSEFCAVMGGFVNMQESTAGFGKTPEGALLNLLGSASRCEGCEHDGQQSSLQGCKSCSADPSRPLYRQKGAAR